MNRRRFLFGLGGAVLALPFLEGVLPRTSRVARANSAASPYVIFLRQGNGVQQASTSYGGEPERFWPSFAPGAMSRAALTADQSRALSELGDHAEKLTFVRGIRFADPANPCRHSGGGNQVLTAASVSKDDCNTTLALGESIDNRVMRELQANEEPLTLYVGRKGQSLDEVLSYRGPRQLRGAERDPHTVYKQLFGLTDATPAELEQLQASRTSVNDLVRSDMQRLLARKDLSKADRARLELHFDAIRDVENRIACAAPESTGYEVGAEALDDDDQIDAMAKLHFDLLALAMSCGLKRAATFQFGSGFDQTRYTLDGVKQAAFHDISHRTSGGNEVDQLLHHRIDRKLLGLYRYLLDRLEERQGPLGTLLDQGLVVYANDLGDGDHSYENIPYLIAGSAGGALRTGRYVDTHGATNNKVLNTIGAAMGCVNAAGAPLDDFGEPSLEKGRLDEIVAAT